MSNTTGEQESAVQPEEQSSSVSQPDSSTTNVNEGQESVQPQDESSSVSMPDSTSALNPKGSLSMFALKLLRYFVLFS